MQDFRKSSVRYYLLGKKSPKNFTIGNADQQTSGTANALTSVLCVSLSAHACDKSCQTMAHFALSQYYLHLPNC